MRYSYLFPYLKKQCLVMDIETWAEHSDGREININSRFDLYVERAKVRWFGAYSYKHDKLYLLDATKDSILIRKLLTEHETIIGFNSEEFDYPILSNNGLADLATKHIQIDCMQILGKAVFKNRSGYSYKDRGTLMGYNFKNNSLKMIAQQMNLEHKKSDIDYGLFRKTSWTPEEIERIKEYLKNDVLATKQMFDKLWDYWLPFTDLLDMKFVKNYSWLRSSIASLTYKSACSLLNIEPTYSEKASKTEEMGGRVIMPKYEEARNVWYVDFSSLYPHIFCMFNLFSETDSTGQGVWHGNDIFKVRGYYNISARHPLNRQIQDKLRERIMLKKTQPDHPMIYAIKIFLNGLYGVARSAIFEKIHTPNCGWDCCWLGQQIQKLTEDMMEEFGFESIYGDTDSLQLIAKEERFNNREYVKECLEKVVTKINENVPFKVPTFSIDIENYLEYVLFPFSEQPIQDEEGNNIKKKNRLVKVRKGKKKNYLYIYKKEDKREIELVGLPIKKDNATALGMRIFEDVLHDLILKNNRAKFSKDFIEETINTYLKKEGIFKLIAQEYKVKPFSSYKNASQLQAQISKEYLNERDGIIHLIKNKKVGRVGKATRYCTVEEALENNLTAGDLDLTKLWNELNPFIEYHENTN